MPDPFATMDLLKDLCFCGKKTETGSIWCPEHDHEASLYDEDGYTD